MTDDLHVLLGSYLLGGLTAADRARFERHLPECDRCRTELVAAAPIPMLLRRTDAAVENPPTRDTLPTLLAAAANERGRRRRRTGFLAAAAAACLVGIAGASAAVLAHDPTGRTVTVVAGAGSDVTGSVDLVGKPWGTAITLTATGLPAHGPFTLQIADDSGTRQQAATWSATPDGHVTVVGATAIAPGDLAMVTVADAAGTTLATARI